MCVAEVIGRVEALLAPADAVVRGRALHLHLLVLVLVADGVAVEAPGQVVPQLGVLLAPARHALGGLAGRAVRGHARARGAHLTGEGSAGERVLALVRGGGFRRGLPVLEVGKQEERH